MWGSFGYNQDRMEELERLELTSGPDIDSDEAQGTTDVASSPRRIMGTTVEGLPPGYSAVTSQSPVPSLLHTAASMTQREPAAGLCIDEPRCCCCCSRNMY